MPAEVISTVHLPVAAYEKISRRSIHWQGQKYHQQHNWPRSRYKW